MPTKKWWEIDNFGREIESCRRYATSSILGSDQKTVEKILDLLKKYGLDPEAVAVEVRKLIGEEDFVFVDGFRPQRDDQKDWENLKSIRVEQLLFACYKVWPD